MRGRMAGLTLVAGLMLAGPVRGQTFPIPEGLQTIRLEPFFAPSGLFLPGPTNFGHSTDGSGRVFVSTRRGQVWMADENGTFQSPAFLDMPAQGLTIVTSGEQGLLGMAFHPDFAVAGTAGFGKFYTHSTESRSGDPDFPLGNPSSGSHAVIREWMVDPEDPTVVLGDSREIVRIHQPGATHQGGAIVFGHDKNLYIALGDGGGGSTSQNLSSVHGSILRIDPLGSNSTNGRYGVPADNPFVGEEGSDEIFAYGLRNPWRISVDRDTGLIYAGDVGQSRREEVNVIVSGGNYGWPYFEGTWAGVAPPDGAGPFIEPIAEYVRGSPEGDSDGIAIMGGFVYRGSAIPQLRGTYIFGDYNGRLFYTSAAGGDIFEFRFDPDSAVSHFHLWGFGEDEAGELYAYYGPGVVHRITAAAAIPGDANLDGRVDISDLAILAGNWQQSGRLWERGDFNGDGIANVADLSILAANWKAGVEGGPRMRIEEAMGLFDVFGGVTVPEPGWAGVVVLAGLGLLRRGGGGRGCFIRRWGFCGARGATRRVDVAVAPGDNGANGQHGLPADNALIGQDGLDQIYAYGLRNARRMSIS